MGRWPKTHGHERFERVEERLVRLLECTDPHALLEAALRAVPALPGGRAGELFQLHGGWLRLAASEGVPEERLEPFRAVPLDADLPSPQAARDRRPVYVVPPDLPRLGDGRPMFPDPSTRSVSLPLVADGECVGVLTLQTSTEERSDAVERRFLLVASLLAHRWAALLARRRTVPAAPPGPPDGGRTAMLELAMSNAGIGSFDWDFATGRVVWDERLCELFGFRPLEFDQRIETFFAAVHPEDLAEVRAAVEESRRTGKYHVLYRIVRPDGAVRWIEAESRVVFDRAGEPQGMIGTAKDRTEEQEREAARRARADFSVRFTRGLSAALSTEDIIRAVAETALPTLGGSSLAVYLADEHGVTRFAGARGVDAEGVSHLRRAADSADSPVLAPLRGGQAYFLESREEYLRTFPDPRLTPVAGHQAWALLPLMAGDEHIGTCSIAYDRPRAFSEDDRTVLVSAAGTLAQALARARLADSRRRYLTELQHVMLPRDLPTVPGLEVAVRYRPGSEGLAVGGDWYDALRHGERRCALVIGDVQGHNARAAAVMGQLRTAMRTYAAEGYAPRDLVSKANETLCALETDLFATCCDVDIDLDAECVHIVRAGHPAPILLGADGVAREVDGEGGLALGVLPGQEYPVHTTGLPGGCTLLLYTDGLVERPGVDYTDAVDELSERLAWWAGTGTGRGGGRLTLAEAADRLVTPVAERPQRDDVALLLLRCTPVHRDE
jgi:PAS domain S-box-containing protein